MEHSQGDDVEGRGHESDDQRVEHLRNTAKAGERIAGPDRLRVAASKLKEKTKEDDRYWSDQTPRRAGSASFSASLHP